MPSAFTVLMKNGELTPVRLEGIDIECKKSNRVMSFYFKSSQGRYCKVEESFSRDFQALKYTTKKSSKSKCHSKKGFLAIFSDETSLKPSFKQIQ